MLSHALDAREGWARTSGPIFREGRREARLRPEYARLYPGLSGEWQSAAILADRVLAHRLLYALDTGLPSRALLEGHFEFRGGEYAERDRPRREDR